ncbi:MAG: hypothetical protein WCF88_07575 [Candidatus Acidiferrales bacterium]|jgi:hypothetical protein
MSKQTQIYVLIALVLLAAYVFYAERSTGPGISGVLASDTTFRPLDVEEPHLRLDLLDKIKKLDYSGSHRNIFIFGPPPPPPKSPEQIARDNYRAQGPHQPPPPPPVTVPAQLFGSALMSKTGKRVAFFLNGDEVLVVQEGSEFLNRYRLDKIGNDSADVEETSSGRHAIVQMVQPVGSDSVPGAPNQNFNQNPNQ